MSIEIRSSGEDGVRAEIEALARLNALRRRVCREYRKADTEDELQATLERELAKFGWDVRREVHCWESAGNRRRIDIYASATEQTETATGVAAGTVVGIELKLDASMRSEREAYRQTIGYASSFAWFDELDEAHLPPPMYLGISTGPLLDGRAKGGDPAVARILWQYGCGYLFRPRYVDLRLQVRRPMLVKRRDRNIITTRDITIPLTAWRLS